MHARRSGERSTTLTDVAIPTIRIRGAHKPRGNCVRKQESLSDREPRGTASGTADVSRPGRWMPSTCRGPANWMPPTMGT